GIAIMVDCMTDNRNRTVAEVRHVFSKRGGNMGTDGCVAFMFNQKGIISLAPGLDEDAVMEVALEAGAEDIVTNDDGSIDVFTTPDEYAAVKDALDAAGFEAQSAEVTMHPDNTVSLELDDAQKAIAMIEAFEELDDVQQVYSNADFSDEVMAQLEN
ncbi:MAG TPA: YebC/PmpR family DNA-binding transcriptional regulator, partial [Methylophaga sp.]|nr:YebC/PmpR family DNA-binding transcriptional regulator [Methylophaga sp.]